MKLSTLQLAPAMGCLLFTALSASAATITGFTASYLPNSQYTNTGLTTMVNGSTARITNTSITCIDPVSCSGQVLSFAVTGQATALDPVSIFADGSLTGTSSATGTISVPSLLLNKSFSFSAGIFNTTLVNTVDPSTGPFSLSGTLSLNLAAGQVLNLPGSLVFSVGVPATSTPEPGSIALLGTGLSGLAFLLRRRQTKSR